MHYLKFIFYLFIFNYKGRVTGRRRYRECIPSAGLLLKWLKRQELSSSEARNQELPESPIWAQGPKDLSLPPVFPGHKQGGGSEVQQPGYKPAPPQEASTAGGGLVYYATEPAPQLCIVNKCGNYTIICNPYHSVLLRGSQEVSKINLLPLFQKPIKCYKHKNVLG